MDFGRTPFGRRAGGQLIRGQPLDPLQAGGFVQQWLHALEHLGRGQRDLGLSVVDDRLNPRQRSISPGRIGRHGHHTRVQAAKERHDKVQPRRIEQQRPLPFQAHRAQPGSHGAGALVQLLIAEIHFVGLAVRQVGEGTVVPLVQRAVAKQVHEIRGTKE